MEQGCLFSKETGHLSPDELAERVYRERPEIYDCFVRVCVRRRREKIALGLTRVRLSARDMLALMRDEPGGPERDGRMMGDVFRVNNFLSRPFAERLARDRPDEFGDVFEFRKRKRA